MFCFVVHNFCYIPSTHLFDSTVKLDNIKFTSTFMPGNSLCDRKEMISLEEPSKSERNVECERGKKAFVEIWVSSVRPIWAIIALALW